MNVGSLRHLALGTLLATVAAACTTPATAIGVVVDTDSRDRVQGMSVSVWRGTGTTGTPETHTWAPGDATLRLPATFTVTPGGTPNDGPATLQLELTLAGEAPGAPSITLRRQARFHFVPHTVNFLRLFLNSSCGGMPAGIQCTNTSVPCTMTEYCAEMSPPQTCGDMGQCVPIDVVVQPTRATSVDESTLAQGTRGPFYECTQQSECVAGTVCVDNGGDEHYFCKPLCRIDTDCNSYGFPGLRCYSHYRQDGTAFPHRVCNDNPGMLSPM